MSQATVFVEYVLENIVSEPAELKINEIEGPEESIIEIRVAEPDVGKVIGKSGSVARALRNVVNAVGLKDDTNYSVEIID